MITYIVVLMIQFPGIDKPPAWVTTVECSDKVATLAINRCRNMGIQWARSQTPKDVRSYVVLGPNMNRVAP